jgi:hypothetical protein
MKKILFGFAFLAACGFAAHPARAQGAFCFHRYNLDHVEAPNDNILLFYMKDGSVYANHTVGRCPGLSIAADAGGLRLGGGRGIDEFCSNLDWVVLRETRQQCLLGAYELQHKK